MNTAELIKMVEGITLAKMVEDILSIDPSPKFCPICQDAGSDDHTDNDCPFKIAIMISEDQGSRTAEEDDRLLLRLGSAFVKMGERLFLINEGLRFLTGDGVGKPIGILGEDDNEIH